MFRSSKCRDAHLLFCVAFVGVMLYTAIENGQLNSLIQKNSSVTLKDSQNALSEEKELLNKSN